MCSSKYIKGKVGWKRRVQNIFNTNMKSIQTSKGGMKEDVRAVRGKEAKKGR